MGGTGRARRALLVPTEQLFKPITGNDFLKTLNFLEADKYLKKLNTVQFIELIAQAQFEQQKSLRDISNKFNHKDFQEAIQNESFSASQISRRLRDLPTEVLDFLFKELEINTGFFKKSLY